MDAPVRRAKADQAVQDMAAVTQEPGEIARRKRLAAR